MSTTAADEAATTRLIRLITARSRWDLRHAVGRELARRRDHEAAVDFALCALRDEAAEPDFEPDGEGGFDVDYEPMVAIARRVIFAAGLGHVDVDAAAWEAIKQYESLYHELDYIEYLGDTHKWEYRSARAAMLRPRPVKIIASNVIDIFWRVSGRAPRLRTNHRAGGSRRSTTSRSSRGDPDDLGDKPPSHRRLPIVGGRR
jgi:hypothetical protein